MSSSFYIDSPIETRLEKGDLGSVKIMGHGAHGNQGNRQGTEHKRLDPEVKASVSVLARLMGNKATGKLIGINQTTVGKYAAGKDSSGQVDPEHKARVEDRLEGVAEKATSALELVLQGLLDPARLDKAKARDLGGIAANLSSVVERMRGKNNVIIAGRVVVMSPPQEKVSNYEVIDVEARQVDG